MHSTLKPRVAAASALALALVTAGCPSSGDTCESSALCAEGTFCFEGRCVGSLPAGACAPPTAGTLAWDVVGKTVPATCDPSASPSTWPQPVPATTSSPTAAWVTALGPRAVGSTVSFDVPPGTASVTIHQQGVDAAASFDIGQDCSPSTLAYDVCPNSVVPTALKAPNGGTIYVDDVFSRGIPQPYRVPGYYGGLTPWAGSYTIPGTSRVIDLALTGGEIPPGTWSFQVNDWNAECSRTQGCTASSTAGRTYDINVVARPGPYVSTGTLDIGIYLAGGTIGAAAAIGDTGYTRFVWAIGQLLGRAGICLGKVTFFDLPNGVKTQGLDTPNIDHEPPCSDLARLFSLASPSVDGVHLFLVDAFVTSMGSGIIGIDGSIPGPSGIPGAVTSGAAMIMGNIGSGTSCPDGQLAIATCGSDYAAYVAAHEIGHWLGLYHPTEQHGDQFDPLADTATCACTECAPETRVSPYSSATYRDYCGMGTEMEPAWCLSAGATCGGGDNLMFWRVQRGISVGRLTAEQSLVMRINPAVKQ